MVPFRNEITSPAPSRFCVERRPELYFEANELMRGIHDRMPVILEPENHAAWLVPDHQTMRREASAHAGPVR
ncbi:MAG: SOS response-associated peptidase family protein [Betaproteobacteria bacterium]|nr:SOS response-associated peptidase family protein [Betaproteobacteria bacterium]MBI2226367.1 SOS response-associated peptidase family protein [Betaproteobacteria bacterium]MBI2290204.1 SOS response-associated peptidase family protein [Betaproteobacteria bacterium]MBI3052976.1 SOS response-associated peptidase family protein [Betaproteobacteria bacterium]